jgi:hypothetical protein
LIKDGWTITHDPLTLSLGFKDVYVDLGAERPIAAEKDGVKIAVEIKSFRSQSDMRDFENAIGQYVFYRSALTRIEPDRKIYPAISEIAYRNTFFEPIVIPTLEDLKPSLLVFSIEDEEIVEWIN